MRGSQVRLSELLTATVPSFAYDAEGYINQSAAPTFQFYGNVSEMRSNSSVAEFTERRDERIIKVIARSGDVDTLTIDSVLTIEGVDRRYIIEDMYESEFKDRGIESRFKSYKEIIAKYITE